MAWLSVRTYTLCGCVQLESWSSSNRPIIGCHTLHHTHEFVNVTSGVRQASTRGCEIASCHQTWTLRWRVQPELVLPKGPHNVCADPAGIRSPSNTSVDARSQARVSSRTVRALPHTAHPPALTASPPVRPPARSPTGRPARPRARPLDADRKELSVLHSLCRQPVVARNISDYKVYEPLSFRSFLYITPLSRCVSVGRWLLVCLVGRWRQLFRDSSISGSRIAAVAAVKDKICSCDRSIVSATALGSAAAAEGISSCCSCSMPRMISNVNNFRDAQASKDWWNDRRTDTCWIGAWKSNNRGLNLIYWSYYVTNLHGNADFLIKSATHCRF